MKSVILCAADEINVNQWTALMAALTKEGPDGTFALSVIGIFLASVR